MTWITEYFFPGRCRIAGLSRDISQFLDRKRMGWVGDIGIEGWSCGGSFNGGGGFHFSRSKSNGILPNYYVEKRSCHIGLVLGFQHSFDRTCSSLSDVIGTSSWSSRSTARQEQVFSGVAPVTHEWDGDQEVRSVWCPRRWEMSCRNGVPTIMEYAPSIPWLDLVRSPRPQHYYFSDFTQFPIEAACLYIVGMKPRVATSV